ncbi:MAG: cytochrome c oxidase subunit 3 [Chitinophagales bacterium]|nr:cytochrome c oxidase subunit 3 [Chitinophagales bacterium]MCZ2394509.1 cytochrome c oxidase subunit 3 [Chitinophagales bacterium]
MAELLDENVISEHITLPAPNNNEGGEDTPFKVSYGKTMMWFFLLSDAFTFTGFLIAYGAIRMSKTWWPDPNVVFAGMPFLHGVNVPLGLVSIMTTILILSSVFVVRAVIEGHRMNQKGVAFWLFLGILGGVAFLGCQAWEWSHLIHDGMTPFYNVYHAGPEGETIKLALAEKAKTPVSPGPPMFGGSFFGITGFHGLHVSIGVVMNIVALIKTLNGTYQRRGHYEMVEKFGLYWHFVDLVWVFVFLFFYLI